MKEKIFLAVGVLAMAALMGMAPIDPVEAETTRCTKQWNGDVVCTTTPY